MVKPLFSATHFRRNLISHGCHIVLKLQHYRVSCWAEKNSSHYLKVMVINMSNWFVTRIWSMASNKKYSPKFHSEFWNKDGLASLFSCGIPRKNERSSFYPVLQKDIMYITLHTVLKLHVLSKNYFYVFLFEFSCKNGMIFWIRNSN